jgi:DNA repair protein RAD50
MSSMEKDAKEAGVSLDGAPVAAPLSLLASSSGVMDDGSNGDSSVESLQARLADSEAEETHLQRESEASADNLARLTAQRGVLALVRRVFDSRAKLAGLEESLATIEADILAKTNDFAAAGGLGSGVQASVNPLEQANVIKGKIAELGNLRANAQGQLDVVSDEVRRLTRELGDKEFAGLEKALQAALIEKTVVEMAAKDLDRYHTALDTALQRYHKIKIDEINVSLRSLWAATYQGVCY